MYEKEGEDTKMYRSYNYLNFIQTITCRYQADPLYIFQIGINKRHASILIMPKYGTRYKVHMLSYSQKVCANRKVDRHESGRWISIARFFSDDAKIKNKSEKRLAEDVQQTVVELKEEKLGKLKERVLDIELIDSNSDKEKGRETTKFVEKKSIESKELSKDDVMSKKGIIIY